MSFLSWEVKEVSHDPKWQQHNPTVLMEINSLYLQLFKAVNGILVGTRFETRPELDSPQETLKYNTTLERLGKSFDTVGDHVL